jgi:hypothetical protein
MPLFMHTTDQQPHPIVAGNLACTIAFLLLAALSMPATCALAQTVATVPVIAPSRVKAISPGTAAKSLPGVTISSKPAWQDLTPLQQQSLKPLAANWNTLGASQKRKWLAVAVNYPKLAPQEQAKLHSRMTEWVSLSQKQREQARLNFADSKQLTPSQKEATWKAYQELSPEEKQKLATASVSKTAGAAAAAKPVPPQKLAVGPVTQQGAKATPKMAATNHGLNHNTLLPPAQQAHEPAPIQKY